MADTTFGARVVRALAKRGPLCVGIDPHSNVLRNWGLDDDVAGAEYFCRTMVDALADMAAFIKPQSAFFERFGSAGVALLERVVSDAHKGGALVIGDVKRGDVGSTMHAYAQAYLDPASPLAMDAVTVSPYQGLGSLQPMFDMAEAHRRGVFIVALSSNVEGATVQKARRSDGRTVAQTIIDGVAEINADADPLGAVGVVIGATVGSCAQVGEKTLRESTYGITHTTTRTRETAHELGELNGPVLVPGMGAQGGKPGDLRRVLGSAVHAAIPSYSRQIARSGPAETSLREAARVQMEACRDAIGR